MSTVATTEVLGEVMARGRNLRRDSVAKHSEAGGVVRVVVRVAIHEAERVCKQRWHDEKERRRVSSTSSKRQEGWGRGVKLTRADAEAARERTAREATTDMAKREKVRIGGKEGGRG